LDDDDDVLEVGGVGASVVLGTATGAVALTSGRAFGILETLVPAFAKNNH